MSESEKPAAPIELKPNTKSIWKSKEEILEWTVFMVWVKNTGLAIDDCRNAIKKRLVERTEEKQSGNTEDMS